MHTCLQELGDGGIGSLLDHLSRATEAAPNWAKAWHNWALYNVNAMEHYSHTDSRQAQRHVAPAVLGFFRSVQLAQAQGGRNRTIKRWTAALCPRAVQMKHSIT